MDQSTLLALAAELRVRALCVRAEERADLLFLATEYEKAAATDRTADPAAVTVLLPK